MEYVVPIGGAPDDPYVDANPGSGTEGSAVPAAAIEHPMREIVQVIEDAGLVPDGGDLTQLSAAIAALIAAASAGLPRAYMAGLTLANNAGDATNDIDIAVGAARSADNSTDLVLAAGLTKQLDAAWAEGTNAGGLDTGAKANSSCYHVHLIEKDADGTLDALFSLSATAPTMPGGWTARRRLGAVRTSGAGAILGFSQRGDEFFLKAAVLDVNGASIDTTGALYTLTVPIGVAVQPLFNAKVATASDRGVYWSSPDQTDEAPTATGAPLPDGFTSSTATHAWSAFRRVRTDTSGRIRGRAYSATCTTYLVTYGWVDRRGRDD